MGVNGGSPSIALATGGASRGVATGSAGADLPDIAVHKSSADEDIPATLLYHEKGMRGGDGRELFVRSECTFSCSCPWCVCVCVLIAVEYCTLDYTLRKNLVSSRSLYMCMGYQL